MAGRKREFDNFDRSGRATRALVLHGGNAVNARIGQKPPQNERKIRHKLFVLRGGAAQNERFPWNRFRNASAPAVLGSIPSKSQAMPQLAAPAAPRSRRSRHTFFQRTVG